MADLQREVQAERSTIGQQRDQLEEERRDLAAQRRLDPILAAAIANTGLLLACVLPLFVCLYLLQRRVEPADDQLVIEVLLEDFTASKPQILAPTGSFPQLTNDQGKDEPADE